MKAWRVLVYLAGDNDLEDAAHADLFEMLKVGSGPQVDVVAQIDGRDSGGARYHIQPGQLVPVGPALGEVNTGDPAALTDFLRWAIAAYPAEKTLLVIWNHGTGWEDVAANFQWETIRGASDRQALARAMFASTVRAGHALARANTERAIALDASSRDFLDNEELRQALAAGLSGAKVDVLGFDACLMAMVEIAYQLRDQAHCMVGSQELEPHTGWPYMPILKGLHANPALTGAEVAALIVAEYGRSGPAVRARVKYTQSAYDLAQISATYGLLTQIAAGLKDFPQPLALKRAVAEACSLDAKKGAKRFRDGTSVDLRDWALRLRRAHKAYAGADGALGAALGALADHLAAGAANGLVLANVATGGDDGDRVHGASIYLPPPKKYNPAYARLDFAASGWAGFAEKVSATLK